jgi:hypothetical protein
MQKKPTQPAKRFTTDLRKKEQSLPIATTARARICRGKVRCAVPRRLFQETGLTVWFFTRFVLAAAFRPPDEKLNKKYTQILTIS